MVKWIILVCGIVTTSFFISSVSSVTAATPIKVKEKAPKKRLYLPYDPAIKLRHPARNSNFDLNLGLSLQRNDMPQVQRWYDEGASVNALTNRGQSFLYSAVYLNRPVHIKFLLQRRANVNVRNKDGNVPIEAAILRSNLMVARYLLERGASGRGKMDRENMTYLQYAINRGQQQLAIELLEHGASANGRYANGSTLLHGAVARGMGGLVRKLVAKHVMVNAKDSVGVTALHEAAAKGYTNIMKTLLRGGAKINAKTNKRWTPLHHAARFGHTGATRLLIRQGARPYVQNSEGKTPRRLARQLKHGIVDDMLGGLSASKQRRRAKALNRRQRSARKESRGITESESIRSTSRPMPESSVRSTSLSRPSHGITDDMIRCVLDSNC
jgi:ankyrin repeat protein